MRGERNHDHAGQPRVRADLAGDRQAVFARKLDIHQDDIRKFPGHLRQALGAAARFAHGKPLLFQEELGQSEIDRVIFDDQDLAAGHALSSFASERCPGP